MRTHSTRRILMQWFVMSLVVVLNVTAGVARTYAQYHHPTNRHPQAPSTNQTAKPKPATPQEKPQKFKDLAIDTEFYYLADKEHKTFPWVKISATSAKSVPTPAKPTATVTTIPAETLVLVKGQEAKKEATGKGSGTK